MNLSTFLTLGRLSNLPTVWSNVLSGLVLGGLMTRAPLAGLLVAASLFYISGMFLNDACDRQVDAVERPERPIPSGKIRARTVWMWGGGMMLVGLSLLAPLGWAATGAGMALCACILFYDMRHKGNPLSPVVMGACRALLYVLAAVAAGGNPPWLAAVLITAYVGGLTYTAKQENLLEFQNAWPLVIFGLPLAWTTVSVDIASLPFLLLFLGWIAYALRMVLLPKARHIRKAVGAMIAGIALLDAVLIAEAGQPGWATAAVGAFALTLLLHRRIAGT